MMIGAVLITFALLLIAVTVATVLGWRRWAAAHAVVKAEVTGPTCTPRVRR